MKRICAGILCLILTLSMMLALSACGNRQFIDTTYTFKQVTVAMPDGTIISGKCDSWVDYDNSDAVQVVIDGEAYYTHLSNVVLTTKDADSD